MADKYITNNAGTLTEVEAADTSAGVADAGEIVALDSTGKIDNSLLPTGVGAETVSVTSSENLAAGDFVNIFDNTGAEVRKADATTVGKEATGFVLASVTSPAAATVYLEGVNNQVTGKTPGAMQFLDTTAGLATETSPSTTGNISQRVGYAISATEISFERQQPIVIA